MQPQGARPPQSPPARRPLRSLTSQATTSQAPAAAEAAASSDSAASVAAAVAHSTALAPTPLANVSLAAPPGPSAASRKPPTLVDGAVQAVLQSVFARFVQAAEAKVSALLFVHLDRDEDLSAPLRAGADLAFDRLLAAVASVAKHCPRLLIDSIMVWRKYKSDNALLAIPDHMLARFPLIRPKDMDALVRERKSLLSNFVLCRVLVEIVARLGRQTLSKELGERLEEMAFGQLRNADPDLVAKSVNRQANVDMFSEFIGVLSDIRFATVSDRFISEIGKGGALLKENKLELIIRSMRFLQIKIFPMDMLEETADFLQTSADLFQNAHNIRVKHAYAEVFTELLDPIAAVATAEVNLPAWQRTVETIYPKAARMVAKPRHLHVALPLISTLLCVARREFFLKNWGGFIEVLVQRFKDKGDKRLRSIALVSLSRLVWVYLFRHFETPASTVQRRIDLILRILFPPNRRGVVPQECGLDAFVRLVYVVLVKYPEYGNEAVISGFLGLNPNTVVANMSALLASSPGFLEGESTHNPARAAELISNPERLIIALRAFLLLLLDMENSLGGFLGGSSAATAGTVSAVQSGAGVVFVEGKVNIPVPTFPDHHASSTPALGSIDDLARMAQRDGIKGGRRNQRASNTATLTETNADSSSKPISAINAPLEEELISRMGRNMRDTLENVNDVVGRALLVLNQTLGGLLLIDSSSAAALSALAGHSTGNSLTVSSSMSSLNSRRASDSTGDSQMIFHGSFYSTANTTMGSMIGSVSNSGVGNIGSGNSGSISMNNSLPSFSVMSSAANATTGVSSTGIDKDRERTSTTEMFTKGRQHLDLLRVILDSLPRYSPNGVPPVRVIEMLSHLMIHMDEGIRNSAYGALCRIARIRRSASSTSTASAPTSSGTSSGFSQVPRQNHQKQHPQGFYWSLSDFESMAAAVVRIAAKTYISIMSLRFQDLWTAQGGFDRILVRLIDNYLDFANIWIETLSSAVTTAISNGASDIALSLLDHPECAWMIDEIESRSVLFLVMASPVFRQAGVKTLWLANDLEEKMEGLREQIMATFPALAAATPQSPLSGDDRHGSTHVYDISGRHGDDHRHHTSSNNSTLQRLSKLHGTSNQSNIIRRKSTRTTQRSDVDETSSQQHQQQQQQQTSPTQTRQPARVLHIMLDIGQDLLKRHYFDRVLATSARPDLAKTIITTPHTKQRLRLRQHHLSNIITHEDCLLTLSVSGDAQDRLIWERCLPDLVHAIVDCAYPRVVRRCLVDLSDRVRGTYGSVYALAESSGPGFGGLSRGNSNGGGGAGGAGGSGGGAGGSSTAVVNKWVSERSLSSSSPSLDKRQGSNTMISGSVGVGSSVGVGGSIGGGGSGTNTSGIGSNSNGAGSTGGLSSGNGGGIGAIGSGGSSVGAINNNGNVIAGNGGNSGGLGSNGGKTPHPQDSFVAHWKLCLVFVAAALPSSTVVTSIQSNPSFAKPPRRNSIYTDRDPVLIPTSAAPTIRTIEDLFTMLIPLLTSENVSIRQAVAVALGSVHLHNHRALLMAVQPYLTVIINDMQSAHRSETSGHSIHASSPSMQPASATRDTTRKTSVTINSAASLTATYAKRIERMRMELTYALSLVAHFVQTDTLRRDTTVFGPVLTYVAATAQFLNEPSVQSEWDHQMLRFYFCSLVNRLYSALSEPTQQPLLDHNNNSNDDNATRSADSREPADIYMPFKLRLDLFDLFEGWCGYGVNGALTRDREARMMRSVLDHIKDMPQRAAITSTMEEQRRALEVASIKAMASLCNGPASCDGSGSMPVSGDVSLARLDPFRLVAWINGMLSSSQTQYHPIARKAIEYTLVHNAGDERMMEAFLKQCYVPSSSGGAATKMSAVAGSVSTEDSKVSLAYFLAIVDLVSQLGADTPVPVSKVLCLALCQISDESPQKRRGAARLLLAVDRKMFGRGAEASMLAADVRQMFDRGGGAKSSELATESQGIPALAGLGQADGGGSGGIGSITTTTIATGVAVAPQTTNQPTHTRDDTLAEDGIPIITEEDVFREVQATYETAAITSTLPTVYRCAQAVVSQRLAQERPDLTYEMLSELVYRIHMLEPYPHLKPQIRNLISTIVPWLRNVDLDASFSLDRGGSTTTPNVNMDQMGVQYVDQGIATMVLVNMLYLTAKFGNTFVTEIETIWLQLVDPTTSTSAAAATIAATGGASFLNDHRSILSRHAWEEKRVTMIVDFLILIGLERRNPRFIAISKQIAVCVCRTSAANALIDAAMSKLTPRGMVPSTDTLATVLSQRLVRLDGLYTVDLDDIISSVPDRTAFSPGQLSFTLLVDVAIEIGSFALRPHLPSLLHVIFVQLDHFLPLMCEQARSFLVNLIQSMLPRDVGGRDSVRGGGSNIGSTGSINNNSNSARRRERVDATLTALNMKEGKLLWSYEDISPMDRLQKHAERCTCQSIQHDDLDVDDSEFRLESAEQMSALALETVDLFTAVHPTLRQMWGDLALVWGTQCPVRHIACRSLQLFRTLSPVFSQRVLGDLLARTSAMLGDGSDDVQGYTYELIETIRAMLDALEPVSTTPPSQQSPPSSSHAGMVTTSRFFQFPQFFWASVSMLHSPHEWEFERGVCLLDDIMTKHVDLTQMYVSSRVLTSLPTRWRGDSVSGSGSGGLEHMLVVLLLPGLCSARTEKRVLDLVNRIVVFGHGSDSGSSFTSSSSADSSHTLRLLYAIFANLPRMLQMFDEPDRVVGTSSSSTASATTPSLSTAVPASVGGGGVSGSTNSGVVSNTNGSASVVTNNSSQYGVGGHKNNDVFTGSRDDGGGSNGTGHDTGGDAASALRMSRSSTGSQRQTASAQQQSQHHQRRRSQAVGGGKIISTATPTTVNKNDATACLVHATSPVSMDECRTNAHNLSKLCERLGHASLARLFDSYSRNRFRSKEDFLYQFSSSVRSAFFPKWESRVLQFLVSLLSNRIVFYRRKVLACLRALFSDGLSESDGGGDRLRLGASALQTVGVSVAGVGATGSMGDLGHDVGDVAGMSASTATHGPSLGHSSESWIQPLLGLLETDLSQDATQVLDEVISGRISVDENDQRIIFGDKTIYRVAKEAVFMGGVHGDVSLAGNQDVGSGHAAGSSDQLLVTATGWRIKDPQKATSCARYNMSGVSMTCAGGFDVYSRDVGGNNASVGVLSQAQVESILRDEIRVASSQGVADTDVLELALNGGAAAVGDTEIVNGQKHVHKSDDASGATPLALIAEQLEPQDQQRQHPEPKFDVSVLGHSDMDALFSDLESYFDEKSRLYHSHVSVVDAVVPNVSRSGTSNASTSAMMPPSLILEQQHPQQELQQQLQHAPSTESRYQSDTPVPLLAPSNRRRHNTLTPAQRLLAKPGTRVTVKMRLNMAYEATVRDAEFSHWLRTDLKTCLRLPRLECIELVRIESDSTKMAVYSDGRSESTQAGLAATLVTIAVVPNASGGNRGFTSGLSASTMSSSFGIESAAYAEELLALVTGDETETEAERRLLLSGVVTYSLDPSCMPELAIVFSGMSVPYMPEGLQCFVPHRMYLASNPLISAEPSGVTSSRQR